MSSEVSVGGIRVNLTDQVSFVLKLHTKRYITTPAVSTRKIGATVVAYSINRLEFHSPKIVRYPSLGLFSNETAVPSAQHKLYMSSEVSVGGIRVNLTDQVSFVPVVAYSINRLEFHSPKIVRYPSLGLFSKMISMDISMDIIFENSPKEG
jgi:1-deoxy-D-xylulose 5-phosphate reductoisomerase